MIITASIEVIEERFYYREKRRMKESERDATVKAMGLYVNLAEHFNNYFLIDSGKDKEEVFDKAKKIILENK